MTPHLGLPDAIAAQPGRLAAAHTTIATALRGPIPTPAAGEQVVLLGIGASLHAARGAAIGWRASGIRASALSAAEVMTGGADRADLYVGVSESGRSTETVAALAAVSERPRIGLTEHADSPFGAATDCLLPLGCGVDSMVYTVGYTTTLMALGMLAEKWVGQSGDWGSLPAQMSGLLADAAAPVAQMAAAMDDVSMVDVVAAVGSGGTAGEGALMLREAARLSAAGTETHDYLHGPMEPLDARTACVVVGDDREVTLAQDTAAIGCPTLLITTADRVPGPAGLFVVRIPDTASRLARMMLEIVPIQLLAWARAQRTGLAADGFRHSQSDTKLS